MISDPVDIGLIHFVGIGGIGMSGIAEIMHNMGYKVQGSDLAQGANVKRLQNLGIKVFIGHKGENLGEAKTVVVSSAIDEENEEIKEARAKHHPVLKRADMLAELMRMKHSIAVGGTHGKTTTTSLISTLFDKAGLDPTIINGGVLNAYGTNARLGHGDWVIAEADESDGSFTRLPSTISVVTNIDPEHMEHYGSFENLKEAFLSFIQNVPIQGFSCLCIDHPEVQSLIPKVQDRRVYTYGFSPQADAQIINLSQDSKGMSFDIKVSSRICEDEKIISGFKLSMFGEHNVLNALAAIVIGLEMNIDIKIIKDALETFQGVSRRFTIKGVVDGITIIDDYGHHPTEIKAALNAARSITDKKVISVFQPHRYTRVKDLFEDFCTCFNDADTVIVSNIYEAGEKPIDGINKESIAEKIRSFGHKSVEILEKQEDLPFIINKHAKRDDVVILLGAGSITNWAQALPSQLKELKG